MKISTGDCHKCGTGVKIVARPVNHILHLILSVVTLSIWIFVWLFLCMIGSDWKCDKCGGSISTSSNYLIWIFLFFIVTAFITYGLK